MMDLNERAARCMGWDNDPVSWWTNGGNPELQKDWNPKNDYNHARMLYERVVERGLEDRLADWVYGSPASKDAVYPSDYVRAALRMTAAQFTLACCEVLEQHDDTN